MSHPDPAVAPLAITSGPSDLQPLLALSDAYLDLTDGHADALRRLARLQAQRRGTAPTEAAPVAFLVDEAQHLLADRDGSVPEGLAEAVRQIARLGRKNGLSPEAEEELRQAHLRRIVGRPQARTVQELGEYARPDDPR